VLTLQKLSAGYAAGAVVRDIDLTVNPGEIVTLIGANGAGKSTLVKTVSGLLPPLTGRILYEGRSIGTLPPAARVRLGIAHVPEGRQVFAGLTVAENLCLGAYANRHRRTQANLRARMRDVCARFPVLADRMEDIVGNFSGGQQQMLAIARGLMAEPKLLILDEPSLGLSPLLVSEIFALIRNLRAQGLAILLSEQNARAALAISDRGYVIESGRVALHAPARDLLASPEIADRYLGISSATAYSREESRRMAGRLRELVGP
jgi:branched-chain amino acid transport system ATP-binding protein